MKRLITILCLVYIWGVRLRNHKSPINFISHNNSRTDLLLGSISHVYARATIQQLNLTGVGFCRIVLGLEIIEAAWRTGNQVQNCALRPRRNYFDGG